MQVTVEWSQRSLYRSTVEVDERELRLWLAGDDESKVDPQREITPDEVKDFLESSRDPEEWKPDPLDEARDWVGSDDIELNGVQL